MKWGESAIREPTLSVAGSLLVFLVAALSAQDSTFLLSTTDPAYRTPAFIGNGAFSLVTTPLGTASAPSFAAGLYDHAPGDVPRIAALPAWNAIDVFDGRSWLDQTTPDTSTLRNYRQTLDLQDGILETRYDWVDGDRRTSVSIDAFVSRANPDLAVVKLTLVPHFGGVVGVAFPLRPQPAPRRLALARLTKTDPAWDLARVWYPGHVVVTERRAVTAPPDPLGPGGGTLSLAGRTEGRGTPVALAAQVFWPAGERANAVRRLVTDSGVALEGWFEASEQLPLTVYKYVAVVSGPDVARSRARAEAESREAALTGYDVLRAAHEVAWHRLWETDVQVTGDPELQRVIHAMLFYLLASLGEGSDLSVPPMGLSSAGYYGHVFWDADTWMFPALAVLHPALARSMVGFRARVLPAAQRNARSHGYRGAMYPWESDERGEETTPRFAWQNALYENHVTGDVALAQWQYYLATGDSAWLGRVGYPVIKETADFWVSRASYDRARDRYDIRHIVSVNEGLIGIGNDTYTNAVARENLEIAAAASEKLGRAPDPRWARVAERLFIPYDSAGAFHPTYEGAPPESRGSVVPLLTFPLELPMSDTAQRHDLADAVRLLLAQGGGAMMGTTLYPIIAAQLGDSALVDSLLPLTYRGHLRPPFDVLAETPRNDAVNFLTGAGGFLQQVVFGYAGLRLREDGVRPVYRPLLPARLTRLVLRNISSHGRRYDIVVERDSVRFVPK